MGKGEKMYSNQLIIQWPLVYVTLSMEYIYIMSFQYFISGPFLTLINSRHKLDYLFITVITPILQYSNPLIH